MEICRSALQLYNDAHNITISAVYTWHHFKAASNKAAASASHVLSKWPKESITVMDCRLNAAEMFVDVSQEGDSTSTNWVAESGVLDLFLLLGPTPRQVGIAKSENVCFTR